MAGNGDAACFYPQEILDLNWNTTSKERIQKAYKVWSVCYDKVLFWGVSKHSIIRDVCELRQGVITKDWPGVREHYTFPSPTILWFQISPTFFGNYIYYNSLLPGFQAEEGKGHMEAIHGGPAPKGAPEVIKMGLGTLRFIGSWYAIKVFSVVYKLFHSS